MSIEDNAEGRLELFERMTAGESLRRFLLEYSPRSLARELIECCRRDRFWARQGPLLELCELAREATHLCPEKAAELRLGGSVMEDPPLNAMLLMEWAVVCYPWEDAKVEGDFEQLIVLICASGLLSGRP
jgi:hypothetical protein